MSSDSTWQISLWDYANTVYSRERVESMSIELQDRYNANVNVLLWATWLEEEKIMLSADVLDDVIATVDAVSLVTVNRLRSVRRDIKTVGGFTKVQSQMISKLILNAELAIEKVLLHRLQDMTLKFMEVMPDKIQPISLVNYLKRLNLEEPEKQSRAFIDACRSSSLA